MYFNGYNNTTAINLKICCMEHMRLLFGLNSQDLQAVLY